MAVKKISVSLDEDVVAAARKAAAANGMTLSAWLSSVAAEAAGIEAGLAAMREDEAEHGPIPDEAKEWAEDVLRRHGIGRR